MLNASRDSSQTGELHLQRAKAAATLHPQLQREDAGQLLLAAFPNSVASSRVGPVSMFFYWGAVALESCFYLKAISLDTHASFTESSAFSF